MHFGISTHLYHDRRLEPGHLGEIAAHGFETIELFATRSHFDYHDAAAIDRLAGWLADAGLTLHSIHAPITASMTDGRQGPAFSTAAPDPAARAAAVREAGQALEVARRIETRFLVVHLGTPDAAPAEGAGNDPAAAARSLAEILRLAAPLGVRVAAEVIPNRLSTAAALVRLVEEDEDLAAAGICLDFGHAFLMGDVVDAVETASGHLITTHVHDNHGRADDHLAPFDGAIPWPAALMALQKIGYDNTLLFELRNTGTPGDVLQRAQGARARVERLLRAD